jgi:hypothetical protein
VGNIEFESRLKDKQLKSQNKIVMEETNALDQIPSRIKYYLLDWKDQNMGKYIRMYGENRLRDLSKSQLHDLFSYVTTHDSALIA